MAKKMKRFLALVIALALCAGQIAVPAMAEEAEEGTVVEVTVELEEKKEEPKEESKAEPEAEPKAEGNSEAKVTVTPIENGTEKVTVTVDASTGTQTTKTEVSTSSPDTGTTKESTKTETVTANASGTQTNTSSDWESKEVKVDSAAQTTGNTTVQTDTNITTTVEGSETSEQTITHDHETNTETVEGNLKGEETTVIEGTTVITETTTGELLKEETIVADPVEEEMESSEELTQTEWAEGEEKSAEWKTEDEKKAIEEGTQTETTSPEAVTPESDGATLELKPDGEEVTVKEVITLEDVLAGTEQAPESNDEQTVEELKDEKGNLTGWKVTKKTKKQDTSSEVVAEDTGEWSETVTSKVRDSGKYTEGTTTEGNVTTTVEKILDETTGEFLGYRVTKVTVTESDNSDAPVVTDSQKETETNKGAAQDNGFTLPAKPVESTDTNAYGDTTAVTVEDLIENGVHVGYTINTVVTSADGNTIRKETKNIYGTASTLTTDEVTDPVTEKTVTSTKVTTTEVEEIYETEETRKLTRSDSKTTNTTTTYLDESDTYQLVETDAGMFFLYKGVMYEVTEIKGSHGNTTLDPIQPDMDLITAKDGKDVYNKNGTADGLFNNSALIQTGNAGGKEFQYVGNGVASTLQVSYSGGTTTNHQFALKDSNGDIHYVYCCDLNTSAQKGYYYEMENVKDADYLDDAEAIKHIQTIALNGFWGTESGDGSLEAVKQLLKESGYAGWDTLTEGQAVTATQAAIWKYGHKDGSTKLNSTIVTYDKDWNWVNSNSADSKNVQALFNLLTSNDLMNNTEITETDLIDKEDITEAAIKVKKAVTDDNGNVVEDSSGNKKYNTDLSFTLKVDKNSITGNLKVYVYANGDTKNPIATRVLAGDGFLSYGIEADENGTYTIEDLEIFEGVNITLNLEGTQDLEKGVYLYTSEIYNNKTSQTFVGVAEGERKVDLEVSLKFEVEDPTIHHTNTKTTTKVTDQKVESQDVSRTDTRTVTNKAKYGTEKTEQTHDVEVYGTVTVTRTQKDITKENRKWESYYQYLLELINDEDGGEDKEEHDGGEDENGKRRLTTLLDEDVPLADAPKTGDISALWAAISFLSLGGMAALSVKRKEEE